METSVFIFMKIVILFPLFLILCLGGVSFGILISLLLLIVMILLGILIYSIEVIWKRKKIYQLIILIILFPIALVWGLYVAISDLGLKLCFDLWKIIFLKIKEINDFFFFSDWLMILITIWIKFLSQIEKLYNKTII